MGVPNCLDPEKLAAWADGGLTADEAAGVEEHLSTCARCQAMLAAFVRSEPATVAAVPLWRRWPVRWLVPIATAAALITWAVLPGLNKKNDVTRPAETMAKVEPPSVATPTPPPAEVKPEEPKPVMGQAPPKPPKPAEPKPAPPTTKEVIATAPPPPPPVPPPVMATPPPPPAAATPPPRPVPLMAQPPVGAVAMADQKRNEAVAVTAAPPVIVEIIAGSPAGATAAPAAGGGGGGGRGGAGGRGGGGVAGAAAVGAAARSVATSPAVRWRILPSGSVERSATAGASWEPVAIDPPAMLRNGAAPSNAVCWLIGRGGAIVRTTDGQHFERVTFPEPVDLLAIRATDALQASVTTVDRRVFVTIDGGVTWRQIGGP
jgi:hypothetical protein